MRYIQNVWGALELEDQIESLAGLTRAVVYGDAMFAAAGVIRNSIRQEAPVLSGNLRRSIKRQRIKWRYKNLEGKFEPVTNGAARVYGGARGSGAAYGVPIEYGFYNHWAKRHIPADPFFRRGQEKAAKAAFAAAESAARVSFEKVVSAAGSATQLRRNERLSVR